MKEIFKILTGSHLYGLATKSSDLDYKGVYLPTFRDAILFQYQKSIRFPKEIQRNATGIETEVEMEIYSLQYFLKLAYEAQTVILDMLFGPEKVIVVVEKEFIPILENRHRFLSKKLNSLMGYAYSQSIKYSNKAENFDRFQKLYDQLVQFYNDSICSPNTKLEVVRHILEKYITEDTTGVVNFKTKTIDNRQVEMFVLDHAEFYMNSQLNQLIEALKIRLDKYGERTKKAQSLGNTDWKALSHALRTICVARDLATKGTFSYPLDQTDLIMKIKLGQLGYEETVDLLDREFKITKELIKNSEILPDQPDLEFFDNYIVELYQKMI